ncbi:MAG: TetR family transcriptional regulator [Polyangiales bacterium]|nr:TetR/AcrR family transcriptional regulator [Sandaracinaceae bacterium]
MSTTRRRRTKEEAREEILTAAAKRLLDAGPDALRIADVAADVGMTHPTLLHHVGSRDELLQDATAHLMQRTAARTLEAMRRAGSEQELDGFVRESLEAFRDRGRTRAVAWLALTGRLGATSKPPWQPFIAAAHAARQRRLAARARGHGRSLAASAALSPEAASSMDVPEADLGETRNTLVLAFLAVFALELIGDSVLADAGLGTDAGAPDRFLGWFASLLDKTLA